MSGRSELAILGATFLSPAVIDQLTTQHQLAPDDFGSPDHRRAWAAALDLHSRSAKIDPVVLAQQLGGTDRDHALANDLAAAACEVSAIHEHARIVKDHAARRRWKMAADRLAEAAATGDDALVAQAEALIAGQVSSDDTWTPKRLGEDAVVFLSDTRRVGIPTGLPRLDDFLAGGLRPGDMTAVGAFTSQGKSAFADSILYDASLEGYSCHVYVNEMSPRDRTLRTIARMGAAPYPRLSRRELEPQDGERVLDAAGRLPFGVTDCSQWTAERIARHVRASRWDLWCLDLVHNMPYERESELHKIVATLAAAARSTGSHCILCCQFNEARAVSELLPVPVARDIRGSGMIKNLSANVLLLHREQTSDGGFVTTHRDGLINVAKSRHGQLGALPVTFVPDRMRFVAAGLRSIEGGAAA